ncbi:helix-turn-helix transcriptional regulator [Aphanothece sacrum]|uniref:DeoR faimly transcriptional regulator n=1 Tax=Aphanothece sacrum FPU1 TaxID=1920663 RepID=A0A401INP5_APHSA|nr:WYL domain-containing protein [Aphanothece sacrum]GBF82869.1 DeoR faimly transcriptional regulator [Aphanothece sacrum FPU1]GBF86254.1 DeoR faimly transcriptional regulator [Aphanothece sacrum FPU3]
MGQTTALSPRRLERLLQMDRLLRNHGRISQPMLAEQLEVTQRTIRDDLHFLQDRLMAPLEYNKKDGWIDLQQLADERIVFRWGAELNLDPEIWQKLLETCRTSKRIWIHYYAATRNQYSERVVEPYLVHVYRATNPYIIGFCHKRQSIRWFRIDRIQQIKILNKTFKRDPNFKADTYLEKIFQAEVERLSQHYNL